MSRQYEQALIYDNVWDDVVGHYISRIYKHLPEEENVLIQSCLDGNTPIEEYHKYVTQKKRERQLAEMELDGYQFENDDDIPATQVVTNLDDEYDLVSAEESADKLRAASKKRNLLSPTFEVFINGKILHSSDESLYKRLRNLEDENMRLIRMFPNGGLSMMSRLSYIQNSQEDNNNNNINENNNEILNNKNNNNNTIMNIEELDTTDSSALVIKPTTTPPQSQSSTPLKPIKLLPSLKSPPKASPLRSSLNSSMNSSNQSLNWSQSSQSSSGSQKLVVSHFAGSGSMSSELLPTPEPNPDYQQIQYSGSSSMKPAKGKSPNKNKCYRPQLNSIGFATLLTLAINCPKMFTHQELVSRAQKFTHIELIDNENCVVTNFNKLPDAINKIIQEEPILVTVKKEIYSATPAGREHGKLLHQIYLDKKRFNEINNTTIDYSQNKVMVVIDTRELKASSIKRHFDEWKVPYIERKLNAGDFCFVNTGVHSENLDNSLMYPFLIERKTWSDLSASIHDQRYEKQRARMMSLEILKRRGLFFLIEGLEKAYKGNDMPDLKKKVEEMANKEEFHVVTTNSLIHTSRYLASFAKLLSEEWSEATGMMKCSLINDARPINLWRQTAEMGIRTNVKRSYAIMKVDSFKEYMVNKKYRDDIDYAVKQSRETDKVIIMEDLIAHKKKISSMSNKMVASYIDHKLFQTQLKPYWTNQNIILVDQVDEEFIDYYLLHMHVILGVKVIPYPSEITKQNTATLRDHDTVLEASFDRKVYQISTQYAIPIDDNLTLPAPLQSQPTLKLPSTQTSPKQPTLALTNSPTQLTSPPKPSPTLPSLPTKPALSQSQASSQSSINPSPTDIMIKNRQAEIKPINLDDDD
ncbi:hypothetical protein PPL_06570 [Heterostelium album PN500]|uniref:Crossover junction endonuclease MUS81 n=1 Tax=Heterostelium pallidum (strain ATCC 26659 / Pp 5 / PN500) TaxID=670386 RepID=D3BDI7_HETP5|nr:hypothetical protein PPL_06570 [Heterostelium album PN500]EFA80532.1 hypothetical protein PPL_06570 [Heterostelium album PN500]|eukprot:XP_020432652.1 hypothetical protein PPL_06570 [Heterostelium album PN500]